MSEDTERLAEWFRERGFGAHPVGFFGPGGLHVAARKPAPEPIYPSDIEDPSDIERDYVARDIKVLEPAFFIVPSETGWTIVVTPHGGDHKRYEFTTREQMLAAAVARLESAPGSA